MTEHRGRTTLSARALQHLTRAVAKDAARVAADDVAVALSDDDGALRVSVVVPAVVGLPVMTIPQQSERLRAGIAEGLDELAGRRVGAVDIRFAGVRRMTERRVT